MFLKVQGVSGEAVDSEHKGEIEVVSWSWGMQGPTVFGGQTAAKAAIGELHVVKRVDKSSTTLMNFLRSNKAVEEARLSVRKAGTTPLEYFKINLKKVRVKSLALSTDGAELTERLTLGFTHVNVSYIPQQDTTGAMGGGASTFDADAEAGSG
jgi:type VI secretion system secreted protein Hcp